MIPRLLCAKNAFFVTVCSVSLALSGCAGTGGDVAVKTVTATGAAKGTMTGVMHGGYNPIAGATVTLYGAGTSQYGSATAIAHTTSAADGSFSFVLSGASSDTNQDNTFTCPTASDQMYLIAADGVTSGQPSGQNNAAAVLVAALGPCSSLGSYVTVNEASTVGTLWAMQQFVSVGSDSANATSSQVLIGSPSNMAMGLANAYQTYLNLVDPVHGVFNTTFTPTSAASGITMTGTPESAKLATIANILAACVNQGTYTGSSSSPCYQLFQNAVPPMYATTNQGSSTTAAVDTAMAAYYMATNPTQAQDGVSGRNAALYNIVSGTAMPFGTGLAAAPTDWTVGITYSAGSTTCTNASAQSPFSYPTQLAVDANGNIWVTNGQTTAANAVAEMSPAGGLTSCFGGTYAASNGIVVDKNGNVWFTAKGSTGSSLYEITGGSTVTAATTPTGFQGYQVITNKNGDIIVDGSSAAPVEIYSDAADGGAGTAATQGSVYSVTGNLAITNYPSTNAQPDIFAASLSSLVDLNYSSGLTSSVKYVGLPATETISSGASIATDKKGLIAGANQAGSAQPQGAFFKFAPGGTSAAFSSQFAGGLNSAGGVAVDGLNNYWSALALPVATGTYAFAEVTGSNFTALSTATSGSFSASNCSLTSCLTGGGFQRSGVSGALSGTAIDMSGNVWSTINSGSSGTVGTLASNGLVEVAGAAGPVLTPSITAYSGQSNSGSSSLPTVTVSPNTLQTISNNSSATFTATESTGAGVTWSLTPVTGYSCSFTAGTCGTLSYNATTGVETYTPPTSQVGTLEVTLTATSNSNSAASASVQVDDLQPLTISPATLPLTTTSSPGNIVPYSQNVTVTGGSGTYSTITANSYAGSTTAAFSFDGLPYWAGTTSTSGGTMNIFDTSGTYGVSGYIPSTFAGTSCSDSTPNNGSYCLDGSYYYGNPVSLSTGTNVLTVSATDTSVPAVNSSAYVTVTAYDPVFPTSTSSTYSSQLNSLLHGTYVFYATGMKNQSTYAAALGLRASYIGSFTADGAGNLTGEMDINNGSGFTNYAFTGTYSSQTNGMAFLTILLPTVPVQPITLAVGLTGATYSSGVLSGTATGGQVIQYDDASGVGTTGGSNGYRMSGEMAMQSSPTSVDSQTSTPVAGQFAFGMQGGDPAADLNSVCETVKVQTCGPAAAAGSITISSSSITGEEDLAYGSIASSTANSGAALSLSGSVNNSGATDAYGRFTASMAPATLPKPDWPTDYVAYAIDATHFYLMSSDSYVNHTMMVGKATAQNTVDLASTPFSSSSVAVLYGSAYGNYYTYSPSAETGALAVIWPLTPTPSSSTAGSLALTGGAFNGSTSKNSSEGYTALTTTPTTGTPVPFQYTVDSTHGRVTMTQAGAVGASFYNGTTLKPNLLQNPVIYLTDTNQGFAISTPTPNTAGVTACTTTCAFTTVPTGIYTLANQTGTALTAGIYSGSIARNITPEGVTENLEFLVSAAPTSTAAGITGEEVLSFNTNQFESNYGSSYLFTAWLPGGTTTTIKTTSTVNSLPGALTLNFGAGNEGCSSGDAITLSTTSFVCMPGTGQVYQEVVYATQ